MAGLLILGPFKFLCRHLPSPFVLAELAAKICHEHEKTTPSNNGGSRGGGGALPPRSLPVIFPPPPKGFTCRSCSKIDCFFYLSNKKATASLKIVNIKFFVRTVEYIAFLDSNQ